MSAEILTFGCRLNAYESEIMRGHAEGLENTIIINSCAVTAEAERQVRQAIRRARRNSPDARIIVTGCAAQIDPQRYAAMTEVGLLLGNGEKLAPDAFAGNQRVRVGDIMTARATAPHLVTGFEGRARAFVQVQNGCDHRCTFCIIPYGRGNSRSLALGEIVEQTRRLIDGGYKEIVLTGVDLTSYDAADLSLGAMVRALLDAVPDLPRLRLSSIDVAEIDDDLMELIAHEPRLMPHLHLSLQAGDDMVLKRMKRRHCRADALAFCARVRALRPDIALGADLIAGFPTETEAMFQRSLDLVDQAALAFLHVFPYSARAGTPAALMPQTPKPVAKARAARLREAGMRSQERYLKDRLGETLEVLIERGREGRSQHYAQVRLDGGAYATCDYSPGDLVQATASAVVDGVLIATPSV